MDALLTPLLESPRMIRIAEELQRVIEAERAKREQFYEDISPEDKWEFINGEVVMHSPATLKHLQIRRRIEQLLCDYTGARNLGMVVGEKGLANFTRNSYEPDVMYFPAEVAETFEDSQWNFPVPSLIVEVLSDSTKGADRGVKKDDYEEHGVVEYWIVDPISETIEQLLLAGEKYELAVKQSDGTFASKAVEGFVMPVRAAFDDELNRAARLRFLQG